MQNKYHMKTVADVMVALYNELLQKGFSDSAATALVASYFKGGFE